MSRSLRPTHENHYGMVPAPPPEDGIPLGALAASHGDAMAAIGQMNALVAEMGDAYIATRLLMRQEAVESSAIEGTNSTLDELLRVEEDDDDATEAARQVRQYATALERFIPEAVRLGPAVFTPEAVREIHTVLLRCDADDRDEPGRLRNAVVWIGGRGDISTSTWTPPPPDRVHERAVRMVLELAVGGDR